MECIELQSDYKLKKKDCVSVLDFYEPYPTREKHQLLQNHALFISSHFGGKHVCEQLFSRMNHRRSKMSSKFCDEHLENSLRIRTTSTERDCYISFTKSRSNIS